MVHVIKVKEAARAGGSTSGTPESKGTQRRSYTGVLRLPRGREGRRGKTSSESRHDRVGRGRTRSKLLTGEVVRCRRESVFLESHLGVLEFS